MREGRGSKTGEGRFPRTRRGRRPAWEVDELDRRVIEQLEQDGRRSYGRIGDAVGLSEAAARQRVQRLLDDQVIRIVAVADPAALGVRRPATVGLNVEGDVRAAAAALASVAEVARVVLTAGSFDLLVELRCVDDAHLLAVLNETIRSVPGVRRMETFTHLGTHTSPDGTPGVAAAALRRDEVT